VRKTQNKGYHSVQNRDTVITVVVKTVGGKNGLGKNRPIRIR